MQKICSKVFHQTGPQINLSSNEVKHRQMRVGEREFYPSFLYVLWGHRLHMIQKFPRWEEGDRSRHWCLQPQAELHEDKSWSHPLLEPRELYRLGLCTHWVAGQWKRGELGTSNPWPVCFCVGISSSPSASAGELSWEEHWALCGVRASALSQGLGNAR